MKIIYKIITVVVLLLIIIYLYKINRKRIVNSHCKESIFINIDWIIRNSVQNSEPPSSIQDILSHIDESQYNKYFPSGLRYNINAEDEYQLDEENPSWISLFKKGRLISSSYAEPHYETGELISKLPHN